MGLLCLIANTGCGHYTAHYGPNVSKPKHSELPTKGVGYRIVLIGDAGAPSEKEEPVLQALKEELRRKGMSKKTTVIFLGDNIYDNGMPAEGSEGRTEAKRRIDAQLDVLKSGGKTPGPRGIFVFGNHDWNWEKEDGQERLKRQEQYIRKTLPDSTHVFPQPGCPGPEVATKQDNPFVQVLVLDTQWWLNTDDLRTTACPQGSEDAVIKELDALLDSGQDQHVMVVAHHPLATHGRAGGFFDWQDHIFPLTRVPPTTFLKRLNRWLWIPLPVVGSVYPAYRWYINPSNQDLIGQKNAEMVGRLSDTLKKARSREKLLIYAAGHEHSLQVLDGGDAVDFHLISGAGSQAKITPVSYGDDTLFAHSHPGFMAVDFMTDNRVLLHVVEPKRGVVLSEQLHPPK